MQDDLTATEGVRARARNGNKPWLLLLSLAAAVVIGMSFGAILYRSYVAGKERQNTCAVALAVRDATTALLVDAQTIVQNTRATGGTMSPEQRKQALDFYARNIKRLNGVDCNSKGG